MVDKGMDKHMIYAVDWVDDDEEVQRGGGIVIAGDTEGNLHDEAERNLHDGAELKKTEVLIIFNEMRKHKQFDKERAGNRNPEHSLWY